MYGWESWTIKKAECQRIDAFELWCWRRLLRVPWTSRRSNQSILKEISPEYSRPWCWEKLKAGEGTTEDVMVGWHHRLDGHEFEQASGVGDGTGKPGVLQSTGSQRVRHNWTTNLNWTNEGDVREAGLIPGSGRSPGGGNGNPFPNPFLPGESHGQRSLAGCSLWGHKEPDTTEAT